MQYSIKDLLNSLFHPFKRNSDLRSVTCKMIWGEASKWTPYGSDNIINLILFWDYLLFPLISDIMTGLKNDLIRWPVPSKGQKKEKGRKQTEKNPRQTQTHYHVKTHASPCLSHQKKMRRMLAMSSTRHTLVEKPSLLLLLWISWYCGT